MVSRKRMKFGNRGFLQSLNRLLTPDLESKKSGSAKNPKACFWRIGKGLEMVEIGYSEIFWDTESVFNLKSGV